MDSVEDIVLMLWSFSRLFLETSRKRVELPRICLEQAPVVFVYSTWCVQLSRLCRCAWDLVENLQLCLRVPLPSNEPSMHALNHTPVDTHWKGLFSSPARHEVETLLVLMDQWPACSPDVDVMTKTEQLSLFNLSLCFSVCIISPVQQMRGWAEDVRWTHTHHVVTGLHFTISVYMCVLKSDSGLGQSTGSHILHLAAFFVWR